MEIRVLFLTKSYLLEVPIQPQASQHEPGSSADMELWYGISAASQAATAFWVVFATVRVLSP